uniref:Myb-like domain-containing protein n=1 Tax=Brassica oleracea var. oleracea TaxID=109376 RepID=A0A0D3B8S3_BRAOL
MDSTPYEHTANFVDLLNSQQDSVFRLVEGSVKPCSSQVPIFGSSCSEASKFGAEKPTERRERRTWTSSDDVVLISFWLNTSKDPLVGNEQRSGALWSRITTYYAASPKVAPSEEREASHCKQRWHKINDLVSKFSGSYEAATREKISGQNEIDVLKHAHEIFYNSYKKKFTLEHVWKEFQNDQKWSGNESSNKRRKFDDGSHSASESVKNNDAAVDDDGMNRPPGVKAAKARGKKKPVVEGKEMSEFQTMWSIKKEDLAMKERLEKMKLLDTLIAWSIGVTYTLVWSVKSGALDSHFAFSHSHQTMNKSLFMHIVARLSNEVQYFRKKKDGLGRNSLSPLQKCNAAIRVLAYGSVADTVDEYLRLGEKTTRLCVQNFVEGIIYLFGDEYLRRPTPADLQRLLDIGEHRGFPGMIGSIDCMHWEWKNYPTAWKEQYSRGSGPKAVLFAQRQEAVRKDVERAFGVLQTRFAIVKNPALFWDKVKTEKIMRACIILHNMIVEDERDEYTQFDVSEFQQGEDNRSLLWVCCE